MIIILKANPLEANSKPGIEASLGASKKYEQMKLKIRNTLPMAE